MTAVFDGRLTPARPDLAAAFLRGRLEAARFAEGVVREVAAPIADLKSAPAPDAPLDTQALRGERVTVYEDVEGWAWGQLERDGYVGYLPSHALVPPGPASTHRVAVARSFVYPAPNMKMPPLAVLPFGAAVPIAALSGDFAILPDGSAIFAAHLLAIADRAPDFVAVAERFVGAPYLWGGKTPDGLDCSGLVQVALNAAGVSCPRDTDMQERALGQPLDISAATPPLRRGDLVFWKGHVGIMRDEATLLHANGHHMLVASEPFEAARSRIEKASFGAVTSIRRLLPAGP
jgi:cell wall-associated NlpC family hydrolase